MKTLRTLTFAIMFVVHAVSLYAQDLTIPRWTGTAWNADGAIVANQSISAQVNISDGTSNTILFSERQTPATDATGKFYLDIGKGTVISGAWSGISSAKGTPWMHIAIDPAGGTAYKPLASIPLSRDGTSRTITFGKSFYMTEQKQVESRVRSVRAGAAQTGRWTSALTPLQRSSACGQQLATMEQQFQATFKTCFDAKMLEFNNAPFVKFAQLCTGVGFVDGQGGPDVNACLTGYEERMRQQCNASANPSDAAVATKLAECKKLAEELSAACKNASEQLNELAKERAALQDRILKAYEAYKAELAAFNAVNARLASVSGTLSANACPTDLLVPVPVTVSLAIPGKPTWQEYSGTNGKR